MRSGTGSMTTCLAFSEDETLLASGHLDGAIYLWELAAGLELDVKMAHDGAVGGLGFPPGDAVLISGGADSAIKFWDMNAAKNRDARRTMRRQPDAVLCLALAKMGQLVVTGHTNRSLRVHDTRDQRLVATIHGHKAPLAMLAVSADGMLVASGARDGAVHVHHLDSRELLTQYREHTRAIAGLAFFPGGQRIATVAMDSTVVVHDTADPENPLVLTGSPDEAFASVAVSADGLRLIGATMEGRFRVWLLQP
jgi:WD40 repeat protein